MTRQFFATSGPLLEFLEVKGVKDQVVRLEFLDLVPHQLGLQGWGLDGYRLFEVLFRGLGLDGYRLFEVLFRGLRQCTSSSLIEVAEVLGIER